MHRASYYCHGHQYECGGYDCKSTDAPPQLTTAMQLDTCYIAAVLYGVRDCVCGGARVVSQIVCHNL